jgi:hypothetical protein
MAYMMQHVQAVAQVFGDSFISNVVKTYESLPSLANLGAEFRKKVDDSAERMSLSYVETMHNIPNYRDQVFHAHMKLELWIIVILVLHTVTQYILGQRSRSSARPAGYCSHCGRRTWRTLCKPLVVMYCIFAHSYAIRNFITYHDLDESVQKTWSSFVGGMYTLCVLLSLRD